MRLPLRPSLIASLLVACSSDSSSQPDTTATAGAESTGAAGSSTGAAETGGPSTSGAGETASVDETGAVDSSGGTASGESGSGTAATDGSGTAADAVCGDGVITGDETCEGEDFAGISCQTLGFTNGALTCGDNCRYSSANCSTCGDGLTSGAETCDGPLGPNYTCANAGFTAGSVTCNFVTCTLDTSDCSLCGNGIIEGPEACDSDNLSGASCASLGFDGGELACSASCQLELASCDGGGYTQDFEGGSLPPEFSTSGSALWFVSASGAIEGGFSAQNGNIGNSQESSLFLDVVFAVAGTVEFQHAESTEDNYDYLQFYIDGVQQDEWSGILAPAQASFPITAGAHTLEWRYHKDTSLDEGSDTVWVDAIELVGGVPTG